MSNSVDPDQTAPIGAVCSGSTLFASFLNSSVMLGNNLQQTTSADNISRCNFFGALRVNIMKILTLESYTRFKASYLMEPRKITPCKSPFLSEATSSTVTSSLSRTTISVKA